MKTDTTKNKGGYNWGNWYARQGGRYPKPNDTPNNDSWDRGMAEVAFGKKIK